MKRIGQHKDSRPELGNGFAYERRLNRFLGSVEAVCDVEVLVATAGIDVADIVAVRAQ